MTTSNCPIDQCLLQDATNLASKAFINTISYKEIYRIEEDDERFQEHLAYLYYRNFFMIARAYPAGLHAFHDEEKRLEVFFMLVPSTIHINIWQQLQAGMLMIALHSGWQVLKRLLKAADFFENKEKELMKDKPYLSLQRMVVHPDKQGKGIGSRRLGHVLKEVADQQGLPVILGTQEMRNVRFYEKLGFVLVETTVYPAEPHSDDTREYSYTTYFMIREPRPYLRSALS